MRIDGRKIADEVKSELKKEISELANKSIVPKIAIITLGDESSWEVYVRQKRIVAGELGIKAIVLNLEDSDKQTLLKTIETINKDPKYHGIIVQRPLPNRIDKTKVTDAIARDKDVDGFRNDSPYEVPVWMAVRKLLSKAVWNARGGVGGRAPDTRTASESVASTGGRETRDRTPSVLNELSIVVIGKGETAGQPTINGLNKMGIEPKVIDTKTQNRTDILKNANIVISCVGKPNVVTANELKSGAIIIGVGIRGEDGKAKGDFDESEIEGVASVYSPTPGGVGPVNLSYLFSNLIKAAKIAP